MPSSNPRTRTRLLWLAALLAITGCARPPQEPRPTPQAPRSSLLEPQTALPTAIRMKLRGDLRLSRPYGHLASVNCLSFSPDGRWLLSGSNDGTLIVWDTGSAEMVQRLEGHTGPVDDCAFLPGGDSRRVVSSGPRGEVFLWDVDAGKAISRFIGLDGEVFSIAVRPDGDELLAGAAGRVMAWSLRTGERAAASADYSHGDGSTPIGQILEIGALLEGPGSGPFLVGYADGGARYFLRPGLMSKIGFVGHGDRPAPDINSMIVQSGLALPGARFAVTRHMNRPEGSPGHVLPAEILVIEPDGSRHVIGTHEGDVMAIAASPVRGLMLAGDITGRAKIWGLAPGGGAAPAPRCELSETSRITAAAFDPSGFRFALAGADGAVTVARADDCKVTERFVADRSRVLTVVVAETVTPSIGQIHFPPGVRRENWEQMSHDVVLLGDGMGRVRLWSINTQSELLWWQPHTSEVTSIINNTSDALGLSWVSLSRDQDVAWFEGIGEKGRALKDPVPLFTARHRILPVPSSLFADHVLEENEYSVVGLSRSWKLSLTEKLLDKFNHFGGDVYESEEPLDAIAVNPKVEVDQGNEFFDIVVSRGDELLKLRASTLTALHPTKELARWPKAAPRGEVIALSFTPDGRWLLEASTTGDVALRDPRTGAVARHLTGLERPAVSLAASSTRVWAAELGRRLVSWNLDDKKDTPAFTADEGARIFSVSAGKNYVAAALSDGSVVVRGVSSGDLATRLIPMLDGSWATLGADGSFRASTGRAASLRLEDPAQRTATTLDGTPLELKVGEIRPERDAAGLVRVRATITSPRGAPTVRLDGRAPITAIRRIEGNATGYEVELSIDDPSDTRHWLEVSAPESKAVTAAIDPDADFGFGGQRRRALVIGNSLYREDQGVPRLLGATRDARAMAEALAGAQSWGLGRDRLADRYDLDADKMREAIRGFFESAGTKDTLLFYYAGHGGPSKDGQGALLPVDYTQGSDRVIKASELWSWIKASPAAHIIVVLDACRTSKFLLPSVLPPIPEGKVGLILAAGGGKVSLETEAGSFFTQAFADAIKHPEKLAGQLDRRSASVTAWNAYQHVVNLKEAKDQQPQNIGFLGVPLARPRARERAPAGEPSPGSAPARSRGVGIQVQKAAQGKDLSLEITAVFPGDADWLVVCLRPKDGSSDCVSKKEVMGRWTAIDEARVTLDKLGELKPGDYVVEARACVRERDCDSAPLKRVDLRLP